MEMLSFLKIAQVVSINIFKLLPGSWRGFCEEFISQRWTETLSKLISTTSMSCVSHRLCFIAKATQGLVRIESASE